MITHEHVICVSSIDWDSKWQAHQEIANALAAAENDVLFIENTGVRAPALRDVSRLSRRLRNWHRERHGPRIDRARVQIHAPMLLPFPYSRTALRINRATLGRRVNRWTARGGCHHPILLTFLPTPLVVDLVRALRPELTIYYCVDDLGSSSPGAAKIRASEAELLAAADLVFVTAERLRTQALAFRDEVHVLPAGVAFAEFEHARTSDVGRLPRLDGIAAPIVGYVGGLNTKTDDDLLAAVARRLPDVHFAIVGPAPGAAPAVRACPNVHLLGLHPHARIPHFLKGVSVGIIPYRVTEYTSHIYPAKLNEYLAMGLPVVSTPLPEVVRFNAAHGDVVAIADGANAFAVAIRRALVPLAPVDVQRRIAVAYANRWELKIAAMTEVIAGTLEARRGRDGRLASVVRGRVGA